MKTDYKKMYEEERAKFLSTSNLVYVLLGLIVAILLAMVITNAIDSKNKTTIPNDKAGVYISMEKPVAIAVLDMNDPSQKQLAQELMTYFKLKKETME